MYERFYNLRESPFDLTSNPKFLYLTPQHQEALSNLEYGLFAAKAVTVLIGEAGTGKTTLIKAALASERCRRVRCVYLNNPALTRAEFVETLARQFDLSPEAAQSKALMLSELEDALRAGRNRGEITALVVDEAQTLSAELLEEVRLLANIETPSQKLLPLILAGQPELADRLNEPGLRQLKQRVALRCELKPFGLQETAMYIATRIRTAGGEASRLFTREAVTAIQERSRGIARTISVICDNALVSGMALGRQPVGRDIVLEVCRDFDLLEANNPVLGSSQSQDETLGIQTLGAPATVPAAEERAVADEPARPTLRERRGLFGLARR
jgi:type II secretory pathway predicted ATPase ExeA